MAGGHEPARRSDQGAPAKQLWLDAWSDPVADVRAFGSCIHTCNLFGDGDWRLVIADADKKLKVWKGTHKASEHALLDTPVALTSFVSDSSAPKVPSLAVAAGVNVYIFRNLKPYYKFVLPSEAPDPDEEGLWQQLDAGTMPIQAATKALGELRGRGVSLATRSLELMSLTEQLARADFVERSKGQALVQQTCVTCMDAIKQALEEPDAASCIVLGTEDGRILILNPAGTAVNKTCHIGVAPAFMAVSGTLDLGYRITVAARDGRLYNIKSGTLSKSVTQLDAQPVGIVRIGKNILVGTMADALHCYNGKGHKHYSVYLPSPILTMQLLATQTSRLTKCVIVALANGEVRVYNEKVLVSVHTASAPLRGIAFGRYAREDNTLISVTRTGALDIKILPRTANLEVGSSGAAGPLPEQDIPLQIPKKTKLYVEQTQREREQCADMHRVFQRDLAKMRLTTARAYVKVLMDGQGPASQASGCDLSMSVTVQGLGPFFKVCLTVRNEGSKAVRQVPVVLQYNEALYKTPRQQFVIPLLVPSLQYEYQLDVKCINPAAGADSIRIVLMKANSTLPLMSALLRMPPSEADDNL